MSSEYDFLTEESRRQERERQERLEKERSIAPGWLTDFIEEAMVQHGPDGHSDGAGIIAHLVWNELRKRCLIVEDDC